MNILILGAGRVGSASAVELASEQDNEVTVVDIDGVGPVIFFASIACLVIIALLSKRLG